MKRTSEINSVIPFLAAIFLLTCSTTGYAQKMVETPNDAKKLVENKELFIGKSLKVLLDSIGPKIKFVFGNPDNTWADATGGTYLRFHFVDRDEYKKNLDKNVRLTALIVRFPLDTHNKHKPLPKGGLKEWTAEETKKYGDMIIAGIRVIGEN